MPQRRRYATRDELAERVVDVLQGQLTHASVRSVLNALAFLGANSDALVKITVDEDVASDLQ